jgi:hypothetical protein
VDIGGIMQFLLIGLIAVSATWASAKELTCSRKPRQHDENNIASFELTADAKAVRVKATLTLEAIETLDRMILKYEGTRDKNSRKYLAIYKAIVARKNDLRWSGNSLPYKKEPKTPRIRYPLKFSKSQIPQAEAFEFFAPEADKAILFVNLDRDGRSDYSDVWIEYSGGQGPYYEHFVCE